MSPEVVFFFGPPFLGKTVYYTQHFSQTHERICPHELFEADPTLSLRAVILRVISFINKGQSVVVDDENSCKKSRRSYITLLKNKVPCCQFRVVNFQVPGSDGLFQCLWSREWHLAQQMEFSPCRSFIQSSQTLEQWFGKRPELPSEDEGFQGIDIVDMVLVGETPYKFEIPALFLQWEGLCEVASDELNKAKVADVVKRWSNSNSSGRVIVIKANEKQPCTGKEERCECMEEMKQLISWLVNQLSVPIYIAHVSSFVWSFSKPPQPGLVAWLQRLHCIDLYHRATFYVHSSESHLKAASTAGVKCIKAKKLFDNPQMISSVYLGVVSPAPECVRKARLAWFGSFSAGDRKDPQQSRPSASLPLYHQALKSRESAGARHVYCVSVFNAGRVHGLCFKDFSSLERYNALYESIATSTRLASNSIFGGQTSSNIRSRQESKPLEVAPVKSPHGDVRHNAGDALCRSFLVKHLLPADIEKHAFSPGHFTRGKGCSQLIRYVKRAMGQDALSLSANCLGSQGQLYDVSVLLSEHGIEKALCSCADPASKLGKCKHVVGLLLWCKREESGSLPETVCKSATDRKQDQRPVQDAKSKSLPSWMSSLAQNTLHDNSDDKVTKNLCKPSGINSKRFKRKQSAKSTLYCMNAEELLETAMQVMEEYPYSQSDPFAKEQTVAPIEKGLTDQMKLDSVHRSQHHGEDSKRRKQLSPLADSNVVGDEFSLSKCRDDISPSLCTVVSRRNVTKPAFMIPETVGMAIEETQVRSLSAQADNTNRTPSSHTADSLSRETPSTSEKSVIDNKQARCQDNQGEEKRAKKLQTSILEDFI